jgi:hypothetical protein
MTGEPHDFPKITKQIILNTSSHIQEARKNKNKTEKQTKNKKTTDVKVRNTLWGKSLAPKTTFPFTGGHLHEDINDQDQIRSAVITFRIVLACERYVCMVSGMGLREISGVTEMFYLLTGVLVTW